MPTLRGEAPRRAATKASKRLLAMTAALKTLEIRSGQQRPGDPMTSCDSGWLWREPGVERMRRRRNEVEASGNRRHPARRRDLKRVMVPDADS